MSLWDDVHRVPSPVDDWCGVEAFDVSDVLKSYWEGPDNILDWDTLPNIAPPFERYFMFGKAHTRIAEGITRIMPGRQASDGVLFEAARSESLGGWNVRSYSVTGNAAWHPWVLMYHVTDRGNLECFENGERFALTTDTEAKVRMARLGLTGKQLVNAAAHLVFPFLLATAILHCKNVSARRVHPPEKLAKAAAKRGRPIYSYSVLDVKPARRILAEEGGMSQGASLAKALHVCRGHFKDYRDGAGLFGRAKGLYWWEQSLRGNVANGVHVKDYRVKS